MARSDLLISLVRAGKGTADPRFRQTVEALIAEERAKQHDVLAERLAQELNGAVSPEHPRTGMTTGTIEDLLFQLNPDRPLNSLVLPALVERVCQELVEEHHRTELLRSFHLAPRHRILLVGPPGNGKTSLAEALANALMVPLLVVRYEGLIGSYLGETASRLRKVFDFARQRACVLFFDEFDTLGKERGDTHDTGEIKRVVSSLLLQIDALPPHVVVVTATNHQELLDRAVWRRFQARLELPTPTRSQIVQFLSMTFARIAFAKPLNPRTIGEHLAGASYSEIEDLIADIARRYVLAMPDADVKRIAQEQVKAWKSRVSPKRT